ncbi:MAG: Hpt domain-containing protein [Treponema sp.]|jgi:HPt (histidine-containing phosphotransfer) domain-containing protein|nr:Hpt domain-containing protein [Treponema sp.]
MAVYVNFDEGLRRVMNNAGLYVKLLAKFRNETSLDEISASLEAGDYEKARTAAHTVKGLAANLSLIELFEKTRDLESQIRAKSVRPGAFEGVKAVFEETVKEVDKVILEHG